MQIDFLAELLVDYFAKRTYTFTKFIILPFDGLLYVVVDLVFLGDDSVGLL